MLQFAEASARIGAPLDLVWSVMLDLEHYPEWNPFIRQIDAPAGRVPQVGDDLLLHVRFRSGKLVRSPERITVLQRPGSAGALLEYEFRGPLHAIGLVRGRRRQLLREDGAGTTEYRTEEHFRGLLSFAVPIDGVRDGFRRHADALKQRAEALAG